MCSERGVPSTEGRAFISVVARIGPSDVAAVPPPPTLRRRDRGCWTSAWAPDAAGQAPPRSQDPGFAVADGPLASYFAARGGVRTFGPPISNAFPLLGSTVQIFRDHVLKVEPNGSVSTVDLFALGAIPFRNVGGRIIPEIDPDLVATAPAPSNPDYAAQV